MNKFTQQSKALLKLVEYLGLIIISIATLVAFGIEINVMIQAQTVTLTDLLLMFIYLEIIAMVAMYLESGKLPIRMPLYIALVALARYLILDMKNLDTWRIIGISAAALIIAITILAIRFGHCRFPYEEK
jgi:protein PsiE